MTNLDRTWKNCLRMWKWISETLTDDFTAIDIDARHKIVSALKVAWLHKHRFTNAIQENCFFCQYDEEHGTNDCDMCPPVLVDPKFHCADYDSYCWCWYPKVFYEKLLEIDKKRRQK